MKTPVSSRTAVLLLLGSLAPLAAQNLQDGVRPSDARPIIVGDLTGNDGHRFRPEAAPPDRFEVPATSKAPAFLSEGGVMFVSQDWMTLGALVTQARTVEDVADLNVLREPSPFRKLAVSTSAGTPPTYADTIQSGLALLSAVYRESGKPSEDQDCLTVGLSIQQQAKLEPARLLALLESEIAANPHCACEIVKHAIRANGSDAAGVAAIVETASTAAPDMMRMISQCAIAEVPEALTEVQAVLARLDPNAGEVAPVGSAKGAKSAKSAESAKVAAIAMAPPELPNPLDRPWLPPLVPPIIYPPPVTPVDPGNRNGSLADHY